MENEPMDEAPPHLKAHLDVLFARKRLRPYKAPKPKPLKPRVIDAKCRVCGNPYRHRRRSGLGGYVCSVYCRRLYMREYLKRWRTVRRARKPPPPKEEAK